MRARVTGGKCIIRVKRRKTLISAYSKLYASFGGLLLFIEGPYKKLSGLKIEQIYMLLKK